MQLLEFSKRMIIRMLSSAQIKIYWSENIVINNYNLNLNFRFWKKVSQKRSEPLIRKNPCDGFAGFIDQILELRLEILHVELHVLW